MAVLKLVEEVEVFKACGETEELKSREMKVITGDVNEMWRNDPDNSEGQVERTGEDGYWGLV